VVRPRIVTGLTASCPAASYFCRHQNCAWAKNNCMPKPNDERIAGDWESVALSRVAARVDELPTLPEEAEDFGWEAGVLEKLRKRLNEIE
jgi:hypothetical protein